METLSQVDPLKYSLSILVSFLEHVFHGHGRPWRAQKGLGIEILAHTKFPNGHYEEVRVRIRPAGWQEEESIYVRCAKSGAEWWPFEGTVRSPRLPEELGGTFSFKYNAGGEWPSTLESHLSTGGKYFLEKAHPEWFEQRQPA